MLYLNLKQWKRYVSISVIVIIVVFWIKKNTSKDFLIVYNFFEKHPDTTIIEFLEKCPTAFCFLTDITEQFLKQKAENDQISIEKFKKPLEFTLIKNIKASIKIKTKAKKKATEKKRVQEIIQRLQQQPPNKRTSRKKTKTSPATRLKVEIKTPSKIEILTNEFTQKIEKHEELKDNFEDGPVARWSKILDYMIV